jgi:hypothetical protein
MAKKTTSKTSSLKSKVESAPAKTKSTPVRNSAVPKVAAAPVVPAKKSVEITQEMIAKRAYEIYAGGTGGSESDNWHRAERELRAGL